MHFRPLHFLFFAIAFVTVKLSANGDIDCILDLSLIEKGHRTYYAHPLSSYNKGTEQRDIALLKSLEMTVVNPNSYKVEKLFRKQAIFLFLPALRPLVIRWRLEPFVMANLELEWLRKHWLLWMHTRWFLKSGKT